MNKKLVLSIFLSLAVFDSSCIDEQEPSQEPEQEQLVESGVDQIIEPVVEPIADPVAEHVDLEPVSGIAPNVLDDVKPEVKGFDEDEYRRVLVFYTVINMIYIAVSTYKFINYIKESRSSGRWLNNEKKLIAMGFARRRYD